MPFINPSQRWLWLSVCPLLFGATAQAQNIEDEPITDPSSSVAPAQPNVPDVSDVSGSLSPAQLQELRRRQDRLEQELADIRRILGGTPASPSPAASVPVVTPSTEPPSSTEPPPLEETTEATTGSNRSLLLPDISLIVTGKGFATNDRRSEDRNRLSTEEAEIGIQGYVYPNVKADAFIVGAPGEEEPFQIEEGYLTFLGVRKNLNIIAGRKFAPFGRSGEQHPHSWLYARQLIPRRNLVSEENLAGDGLLARYLLPTGKKLYANLDVGLWNATESEAGELLTDTNDIIAGPAASFVNRFYSARLSGGYPINHDTELELGASYARGDSSLTDDNEDLFIGRSQVTGLDFTLRKYMNGGRRALLRSEYFRYQPQGELSTVANSASGYYVLGNYRFNPYNDVGLLYESSGFPQLSTERETALSLIYTRQFSEQFYFRLQGTRGDRPGGNYNELIGQLTWGIGPHTHNLE